MRLAPLGMVLAVICTCPECGGSGWLMDDPSATWCPGADECWACEGSGRVSTSPRDPLRWAAGWVARQTRAAMSDDRDLIDQIRVALIQEGFSEPYMARVRNYMPEDRVYPEDSPERLALQDADRQAEHDNREALRRALAPFIEGLA